MSTRNLHESLHPYQSRALKGLLREVVSPCGKLVLYNYTDHCTYKKDWDEYTLASRGLIFEIETGKCVARPFPKFFNLGEHNSTFLFNLPNEPYAVMEKVDGSLGIIYYYEDRWNVATRGSFASDQSREATKMLENYSTGGLRKTYTYLCEIIYPENKIIVNYGNDRKLVLLGARHTETGVYQNDMKLSEISSDVGFSQVSQYTLIIEEAINLQKTLPKDNEGFVIEFESGFRVKIKGDEYLKIAKIMAHMTPLAFWEVMMKGKVPESYLAQIPEELRSEWEPIVRSLENTYSETYRIIRWELNRVENVDFRNFKDVGIYIKNNPGYFTHPELVWPILRDNYQSLDRAIMSIIKPKGNELYVV